MGVIMGYKEDMEIHITLESIIGVITLGEARIICRLTITTDRIWVCVMLVIIPLVAPLSMALTVPVPTVPMASTVLPTTLLLLLRVLLLLLLLLMLLVLVINKVTKIRTSNDKTLQEDLLVIVITIKLTSNYMETPGSRDKVKMSPKKPLLLMQTERLPNLQRLVLMKPLLQAQ